MTRLLAHRDDIGERLVVVEAFQIVSIPIEVDRPGKPRNDRAAFRRGALRIKNLRVATLHPVCELQQRAGRILVHPRCRRADIFGIQRKRVAARFFCPLVPVDPPFGDHGRDPDDRRSGEVGQVIKVMRGLLQEKPAGDRVVAIPCLKVYIPVRHIVQPEQMLNPAHGPLIDQGFCAAAEKGGAQREADENPAF